MVTITLFRGETMLLPKLNDIATTKDVVEEFRGYDHNLRNAAGEWYDMKNMTTDYYPVASPRTVRALQKKIQASDLAYIDNHLISLHQTENVVQVKKDGDLIGEYAIDESDCRKRSLVRNGARLAILPDGVVFENDRITPIKLNKTFEGVTSTFWSWDSSDKIVIPEPDFTVGEECGLRFFTCVPELGDVLGYQTLWKKEKSDKARYEYTLNGVREYLKDSAMWVDIKTYVLILNDDPEAFDKFSVGDNVTFSFSDADEIPYRPDKDDEDKKLKIGGLFEWDREKNNWKMQDRVIIDVGRTTKHKRFGISDLHHTTGQERAYMVVEGYQFLENTDDTDGKIIGTFPYVFFSSFKKEYNASQVLEFVNCKATVNIARRQPDIAFACESQNRVWCCSKNGHEIYASARGNPYNYYVYSHLSTDSYAVNVGTEGEFTGCCNYLGYPLFFKENALHTIFGSFPEQYTVRTETEFDGVEKGSEKSLAIVNNILYYKSPMGIVAYDGSNTILVSDALGKEKYRNAVAGAYRNKYYVSMQNCTTGEYEMFVYDTSKGTWCREDHTAVLQFLSIHNELMYFTGNEIISVGPEISDIGTDYSSENKFNWYCETGTYGYSYPNNKYLSRFQIRMQLGEGARASFYIQYNSDGIWHRKGEMHGKGLRTYLIPLVPMRCDHMKIKIEGCGDAKIYSVAKLLEEGGDC